MKHWEVAVGALVVSGSLIVEVTRDESKFHADYSAPSVIVAINQANTNVSATMLNYPPGPMSYQTRATSLFLAVKG